VAPDLRSLHSDNAAIEIRPQPAWKVEIGSSAVTVHSTGVEVGDSLDVVRAAADAVWRSNLDEPVEIRAADDTAREALERWSLLPASDRLA
jgi:hypothetical protein